MASEATTNKLPAHIIDLMKKAEAYEAAKRAQFQIIDRTPAGYGPQG